MAASAPSGGLKHGPDRGLALLGNPYAFAMEGEEVALHARLIAQKVEEAAHQRRTLVRQVGQGGAAEPDRIPERTTVSEVAR